MCETVQWNMFVKHERAVSQYGSRYAPSSVGEHEEMRATLCSHSTTWLPASRATCLECKEEPPRRYYSALGIQKTKANPLLTADVKRGRD